MTGHDKKIYKQLSHQDQSQGSSSSSRQALSPPQTVYGSPLVSSPAPSPGIPGAPSVVMRSVSGSSTYSTCEPHGPLLCDSVSSKTLFYLKATLTASFQPDYDFTDAKSEEFSREPSVKWVMETVRSDLSATSGDTFTNMEAQVWAAIDEEIKLSECDIYR